MAAWIAAWSALPIHPQVSAGAGTTSQADCVPIHFDPVPDRHLQKAGVESACVVFPPSVMPQIVAVLAQLTLAHARRTTDPARDCQEDRPP